VNTNSSASEKLNRRDATIQLTLRRFFAQMWVELTVGVLVIVSVVLTLFEFTIRASTVAEAGDQQLKVLEGINDGITFLFIVELSLRFVAASKKSAFFRTFWIDIIAVLPLFRIFRVARALRLLRLFRVLRLFGVISRLSSHFPTILRRGLVEYLFVTGLLVMTVIFGTGAMMYLERGKVAAATSNTSSKPDETFDFENSFWFSVYSLFAGEPTPIAPRTLGGKIVAVFIMFMGLTIFAMFTGTFSAFMVERFRTEGKAVDWEELNDHIIICGWNGKAEIIIDEYQASSKTKNIPIVVIAQFEGDLPVIRQELKEKVMFLNDDFTRVVSLELAGAKRARTCIILSDMSGGRSEQDADARTILCGLTVEKINSDVYTCAELINRSYGVHLTMGHVDDYVISGEYSAYMLAQAAMNRGLMGVFTELLTYTHGNEFYRLKLPSKHHGKSFNELLAELKGSHNVILIAVCPKGGEMSINPPDHTFAEGDEIVVIAEQRIEL